MCRSKSCLGHLCTHPLVEYFLHRYVFGEDSTVLDQDSAFLLAARIDPLETHYFRIQQRTAFQ